MWLSCLYFLFVSNNIVADSGQVIYEKPSVSPIELKVGMNVKSLTLLLPCSPERGGIDPGRFRDGPACVLPICVQSLMAETMIRSANSDAILFIAFAVAFIHE